MDTNEPMVTDIAKATMTTAEAWRRADAVRAAVVRLRRRIGAEQVVALGLDNAARHADAAFVAMDADAATEHVLAAESVLRVGFQAAQVRRTRDAAIADALYFTGDGTGALPGWAGRCSDHRRG